jgi:hypothetical protein
MPRVDLSMLREALEASWSAETSYRGVVLPGNPAYGQCYPTARVVQHFFPATEVVEGEVSTGDGEEAHFWNVVVREGTVFHIDLSWSQFPVGSSMRSYAIRDCSTFGDGPETVRRVETLLGKVTAWLDPPRRAGLEATVSGAGLADPAPGLI